MLSQIKVNNIQVTTVDEQPTAGSYNLVNSNGIENAISNINFEKENVQRNVVLGYQLSLELTLKNKICRGSKYSFEVDAGTTGIEGYYFYATYEGESSHTNLGHFDDFNTPIQLTAAKNIESVDIYMDGAASSDGVLRLSLHHDTNDNIFKIQDEFNKLCDNEETSSISVSAGSQFSIPKINIEVGQGKLLKFRLDDPNNVASTFRFYVFKVGQSEHTGIGYYAVNTDNYIILTDDIYAVDGFMMAAATGVGRLTLSVKSDIEIDLEKLNRDIKAVDEKSIIAATDKDLLIYAVDKVYTSESDNVLDLKHTFKGLAITNEGGNASKVVRDANGILSNRIPLLGATKITVSGYPTYAESGGYINLIFLVDDTLNVGLGSEYWAYHWSLNSGMTQRTINVPSDAKYALITLKAPEHTQDYSQNMKVSLSDEPATESFVQGKQVSIYGDDDNLNIDIEKENTIKRYLPYTICIKPTPFFEADSRLFSFACNLLFFADSHVDETFFDSVDLKNVKYVVDFANTLKHNIHDVREQFTNTPVFDAVVHAGDVISSGYKVTSEHDEALAVPFFNIIRKLNIPFVFAPGNHDTLIRDTAWASMYGDWAENKFGLARQTKANGNKSSWSYYDIEAKKIRIIAVDLTNVDLSVMGQDGYPLYNGGNTWYIAQEQMNWLINTALNFDDKADSDWGVVCVMHHSKRITWNDNWYEGSTLGIPSAIQKFFEVCKAFNSQGTYSDSYTYPTDSFYNLNINADFTRYASAKKWKQYNYTQNQGSAGSGKYAYCIKKDDGLTVRMDDANGNMTQYHLYVWYEGASDYTHIALCQPNQEYNIALDNNIVGVQVYLNASDITGNVSSTFKILENKPHIVCWLNGHEHMDAVRTIDGINIIWTICGAAWTAYSDQRVLRSVGTPTQNAFDCISIDTINRKIRMVRYGAGVNCFGVGGDRFLPEGLRY